MTDRDTALALLAAANPIADPMAMDEDELHDLTDRCERVVDAQRRGNHGRSFVYEAPVTAAPERRRRPSALAFGVAFGLTVAIVAVAAFLGRNTGPDPADEPTVTTTTLLSAPTYDIRSSGSLSYVPDMVYATDGGLDLTMSVFFPVEGSGPWPVVVIYAQHCTGCDAANDARIIAARGAVVFAPVWEVEEGTASEYVDGSLFDRASCAVGFAQASAAQFGGDPSRTLVMGDAGGEHPATWAALGLTRATACREPIRYSPKALIVGDPQWLFHQDIWDGDFADPTSPARDTIDRFLNPLRWHAADDLSVFLWSSTYLGAARSIDGDPADATWISDRDTTGTLFADLASVGAFDDSQILLQDSARLMEAKLEDAGIDVTARYYSNELWGKNAELYDEILTFIDGLP